MAKQAPTAISGKSKAAAQAEQEKTKKSSQAAGDMATGGMMDKVGQKSTTGSTTASSTPTPKAEKTPVAEKQDRDYGKEAREAYKDAGPKPNKYAGPKKKPNYERDFDL
jgi:hypothetical protein